MDTAMLADQLFKYGWRIADKPDSHPRYTIMQIDDEQAIVLWERSSPTLYGCLNVAYVNDMLKGVKIDLPEVSNDNFDLLGVKLLELTQGT